MENTQKVQMVKVVSNTGVTKMPKAEFKAKYAKNYDHATVDKGHTESKGVRSLRLMKTMLGPDFMNWHKHPNHLNAIMICHSMIYNRTSPMKVGNGINNYQAFGVQAYNFDLDPAQYKKRLHYYNQISLEMFKVGLVTAEEFALASQRING